MNVPPRASRAFASTRDFRWKAANLCLVSVLILNATACKEHGHGDDIGIAPKDVEVVATLIGVAAEVGVLALTKNHLAAASASGLAGVGAAYIIDQLGLTCKACGTASTYERERATELEPRILSCSNEACRRFAFLVVSNAQDRLDSTLQTLKANLQPTCLLMKETSDQNEIKLKWVSHNATEATLDGKEVSTNGSHLIYPDRTITYVLKVIGANGRSEDSVTVEVAQPVEPEPGDDGSIHIAPPPPPPPPPNPPVSGSSNAASPVVTSTKVGLCLDKIEVYEDGSLGATDWSFEIILNGIGVNSVPKRSYHDDGRRLVQFARQTVDAVVPGNEVDLRISGFNFDGNRRAEGTLHIPVALLQGATQRAVQVTVPDDQRKGYFIFYVTITK